MRKKKKNNNSKENWSHKNDYPIEEVWGTYHILSQLIVPRLLAFKALDKHGYAPGFKNMDAWNKAIQKMIDAFELLKYNSLSSDEDEQRTVYEGLDLFCKYFLNLWD